MNKSLNDYIYCAFTKKNMIRLYNINSIKTRNVVSLVNISNKNIFNPVFRIHNYGYNVNNIHHHSIRPFRVSNIWCNTTKDDNLLFGLKKQFNNIKQITIKYCIQFNNHFNRLRLSLKEANRKILEQETQFKKNYNNANGPTNVKLNGLLPSEIEFKRKLWSRKLEFYMDSLQETLFTATRALNDVTGYSSIQNLRNSINKMENDLNLIKLRVKENKKLYNDAINQRIQSQNEVNDLLQRKGSWSSEDLEKFTRLYKEDAINSKRVEECKQRLSDIEMEEDRLNNELYKSILTRYHEEQIWSDKIRRTSTWGTFLLMGINICLFLIFQLLLEPWKRRRLTRSFEDKVKNALDTYSKEQENLISMKIEEMLPSPSSDDSNKDNNKQTNVTDDYQDGYGKKIRDINLYMIIKRLYFKLIQFPKRKKLELNDIETYLFFGSLLFLGNLLTIIVYKLI